MGLISQIAKAINIDALSDAEIATALSDASSLAEIPQELLPAIREQALPRLADAVLEATPPEIAEQIREWADTMEAREGPLVWVWKTRLPWHAALLVVDRGEAPIHWPAAFSEFHVERAAAWLSGQKIPFAVSGKGPGGVGSIS